MARTRLGLFDSEKEYVQKLGAYIMLKEKEVIELHTYTDLDKLLLNLENLDAVLVPEEFEGAENDSRFVRLVENRSFLPGKQIEKYQKASELIGDLKEMFGISTQTYQENLGNIISVVSPARHELQMFYTMCLCKELSINERVLYLNLCENSGFLSLFQDESQRNIEDLFSAIEDPNFSAEKYVQNIQGVSLIAPSRRPELLWEVEENMWNIFWETLKKSPYKKIIVDVGQAFPEYYRLLEMSDEIQVLGKEGFLSEYCCGEFVENVRLHLGEEVDKKITNLILPLNSGGIWESQFLIDDLFRGNLGDYVRKNIENKNEGVS